MQTHTANNWQTPTPMKYTSSKEMCFSSSINQSLLLSVSSSDTSWLLHSPSSVPINHIVSSFSTLPGFRVMPKVTLAGLSSWACLGTSAAMSKYCFWPSHRWHCCGRIELGTIFTSVGQTVLTCNTMTLSRGPPAAERGSNSWRVRSKHTSALLVFRGRAGCCIHASRSLWLRLSVSSERLTCKF